MTIIQSPRAVWPIAAEMLEENGVPSPDSFSRDSTTTTIIWNTDLTQVQIDKVTDIIAAAKMRVSYPLYVAIKPELPIQRQYYDITGTPSAAQRRAWERSTIRVMRALFKFD